MNLIELFLHKFKKNRELSQSFVWRLVQILGKQGASGIMFFISAYFLAKEDMGIYNYVFSVLTLLVMFSDFGISTATSRYIAEYNSVQKERVKRVLFNSGTIILIISTLAFVLTLLFGKNFFPDYYQYLLVSLPLVFLSPMSSLLDGVYRGLKKFKILSIITLASGFVSILASYLLVSTYGLTGAILAQIVLFFIMTTLLFIFNGKIEFRIDKKILKDVGTYSIYFGIATLGYYLFSKVNILILGQYDLLEEIAVYELLNKMYIVYLIPFTVLGQVLAPNVVELFSTGKYESIRSAFKKLLLYLSLLAILFIPISIIVSKVAIHILLPQYSGAILMSLLFPIALTYANVIPGATINSGIITSTGHASIMAVLNVVSGIINVVLNIWAVREYGYIGVVWVTLVVQLISVIVLYLVYYSKLKEYRDEK
ncbi:MAG: oligosaccharide flippase family protein [Candidatus Dojkabacteria bacterium]